MRALDLDLVRRRPVWPAWLLLGVGGLLFGDALLDTLRLRDEMGQVERRRGSSPGKPCRNSPCPGSPSSSRSRAR
jgi:hypothetical protein